MPCRQSATLLHQALLVQRDCWNKWIVGLSVETKLWVKNTCCKIQNICMLANMKQCTCCKCILLHMYANTILGACLPSSLLSKRHAPNLMSHLQIAPAEPQKPNLQTSPSMLRCLQRVMMFWSLYASICHNLWAKLCKARSAKRELEAVNDAGILVWTT